MKVRKKPVVVEAKRISIEHLYVVAKWCGGGVKGESLPRDQRGIDIQTLEGEMRGEMGDWIIKGVNGEFYPCKPGIFEKTYEILGEGEGN